MAVSFELEPQLETQLRRELRDLDDVAKEAFLVTLFRRGKLSHTTLSAALGLDRFQTDALLKRHNVVEGSLTWNDLEADRTTLERVIGPVSGQRR